MSIALNDAAFARELTSYGKSAFRLELQPAYAIGNERDLYKTFLSGSPEPPTSREEFRAYYRQIKQKTAAGVVIERVRLVDDPPTDYQRWTRYMDAWNTGAGEAIHYLQRQTAARVGLTRAFAGRDWWLLDDSRLVLMSFDGSGRRTRTDLTVSSRDVQRARLWRDLAITTARGED
jgi:hypothetical protein